MARASPLRYYFLLYIIVNPTATSAFSNFLTSFFTADIVVKVLHDLFLTPFSYHLARDEATKLKPVQLFGLQIASRARGPSDARRNVGEK